MRKNGWKLAAMCLAGAIMLAGCGKETKQEVPEKIENEVTATPEPEITEPEIMEPEIMEPEVMEPEVMEPGVTEPAEEVISLKEYCKDFFKLGVGINGSTLENLTLHSEEYMGMVKQHFNSCTMSNLMKSCYILKQDLSIENAKSGDGTPVLTYESIDPTLQWCMDNGVGMRGHTLVWHAQAPDWFFREGYTNDGEYVDKETMLFRMESYIKQLMTHVQDNFPGVVYCWDVVNEAVDPHFGDKNTAFSCRTQSEGNPDAIPNPWYITIGEDYVEMAFTYARKYAAEGVKLFYNDFNTYENAKREYIYTLCKGLKEKGLIDGIGMQSHFSVNNNAVEILMAVKKFCNAGYEVQMTELDIGMENKNPWYWKKQTTLYKELFEGLVELKEEGYPITGVTVWGLSDTLTWRGGEYPLLFNTDLTPKDAYYAVLEGVK